MAHRLAKGQTIGAVIWPNLSSEYRNKALGGGFGRFEMRPQTIKRLQVIFDLVHKPVRKPCERPLVTGQDQLLIARVVLKGPTGGKPIAHGIGHGLGRVDAKVWRDRR